MARFRIGLSYTLVQLPRGGISETPGAHHDDLVRQTRSCERIRLLQCPPQQDPDPPLVERANGCWSRIFHAWAGASATNRFDWHWNSALGCCFGDWKWTWCETGGVPSRHSSQCELVRLPATISSWIAVTLW